MIVIQMVYIYLISIVSILISFSAEVGNKVVEKQSTTLCFVKRERLTQVAKWQIEQLKAQNRNVIFKDRKVKIYRTFLRNKEAMFLAVDLESLTSFLIAEKELHHATDLTSEIYLKTNFARKLNVLKEIRRLDDTQKGYALTVDLCPASNTMQLEEKDLFLWLVKLAKEENKAIPVAIAVTGKWMDRNPVNLVKILNWQEIGALQVTWVNHSSTHPINEGKFLTAQNIQFEEEVFTVESKLLENGIVPSVFFRFPGLISNEALIKKLANLSLIPLGANAWLAKGQKILPRSVILVHGNGNEHSGIIKLRDEFKNGKQPLFQSLN